MNSKRPKGTYRLVCPHCETRQVEMARRLWILRGFIVSARYGTMTLVGCAACVRAQARREIVTNLLAGWWCIPWGLGTPIVVLQNLIEVLRQPSEHTLEAALREAGIDPEDVRVDARGFTGEQRRMLDAAYVVLGRSIVADGRVDSQELDLAVKIVSELTSESISRDEIIDALLLADENTVTYERLGADYRFALLRMALNVAVVDGVLSSKELEYLRAVADLLQLGTGTLDRLLDQAGIGQTEPRKPHATDDKLTRALTCLGVSDPTDVLAIKAAYRRLMLRHHPDRADLDDRSQADSHSKAQEINWAYEYLTRYAKSA